MTTWTVIEAECIEHMRTMDDASVDAVVCDPPYGLEFMGKDWDALGRRIGHPLDPSKDMGRAPEPERGNPWASERPSYGAPRKNKRCKRCGRLAFSQRPCECPQPDWDTRTAEYARVMQAWHEAWAREALRVLKPGGHLLAFGGTRTYHRLACAIEDAGFEIRDTIAWQHMEGVFCACDSPLRRVRDTDHRPAGAVPQADNGDVLSPMQRDASGSGVGDVRQPGPSGVDGREQGQLPREDERRAQPGVEGRRDAQAPEGKLRRGAARPGADVGAPDGASGRVHRGAPPRDGDDGRSAAHPDGSGASPRPQPVEQHADESGTLAVEWIPQGGGAWPGCPRCGKPLAPPFFGGPLIWEYGSGFPKSLDVSKAIDAAAGATREVGRPYVAPDGHGRSKGGDRYPKGTAVEQAWTLDRAAHTVTAPATPDAERWQGWGTALKPAHEPIVVARKPLAGTVAGNVLAHGTGALNVDGCRIASPGEDNGRATGKGAFGLINDDGWEPSLERTSGHHAGRWPANVVLDPEAAAMLDEQTGTLTSGSGQRRPREWQGLYEYGGNGPSDYERNGDSGGASRFFYCAKSSSAERNAGLDGFPEREAHTLSGGEMVADGRTAVKGKRSAQNVHPTVKPIALMRWLVRLVTPPGGTVLDPFAGSGTTGCAAMLEGFRFVGIERDPEYTQIARARIAWWAEHPEGMELVARLEHEAERKRVAGSGQLGLFG